MKDDYSQPPDRLSTSGREFHGDYTEPYKEKMIRKGLLTLFLIVSSADNLCKQIRPRSGPTKCRACSGSNLFDTQMVLLKEFFSKKMNLKKTVDNKKA